MLKYAMINPDNIIIGIGDSPTEAENNAYYNSNPQLYGSYPVWLQYSELEMWKIEINDKNEVIKHEKL